MARKCVLTYNDIMVIHRLSTGLRRKCPLCGHHCPVTLHAGCARSIGRTAPRGCGPSTASRSQTRHPVGGRRGGTPRPPEGGAASGSKPAPKGRRDACKSHGPKRGSKDGPTAAGVDPGTRCGRSRARIAGHGGAQGAALAPHNSGPVWPRIAKVPGSSPKPQRGRRLERPVGARAG